VKGSKTSIIIAGAEHPTGLGMARAMAGKDVHITGVCRSHSHSCRSKVWDELVFLDDFDHIAASLESMGVNAWEKSRKKGALFAASDDVVKRISDHRRLLERYYLFNLPEKAVVDCFLDKTAFHEWALENGFKVPVSHVCSSHDELEKCLERISFPIIIKPFEKSRYWDLSSPIDKTFYLRSRQELNEIPFDLFSVTSRVIMQEYVRGGDGNVYFCLAYYDRRGNRAAHYVGRKILQWPPLNGSTAIAVGDHNEEVSRITEAVFSKARFKGLGSLEFKKDAVDGKLYIIEPTIGRNDFQSGIAVAGGTNLPAIALADLLDRKRPPFKYRRAVWMHEEGVADNLLHNRSAFPRGRDLLKIFHFRTGFALFSVFDPMPALTCLKDRLIRMLKKNRNASGIATSASSKPGGIKAG
jgi:D-aspartate ligase